MRPLARTPGNPYDLASVWERIRRMPRVAKFVLACAALLMSTTLYAEDAKTPRPEGVVGDGVPAFTVRPGYRVTLVAKDLGEARFLAFDEAGTLYVSQPKDGTILALKDTDS